MTNLEKMKQMNDRETAKFIYDNASYICKFCVHENLEDCTKLPKDCCMKGIRKRLNSEVEE